MLFIWNKFINTISVDLKGPIERSKAIEQQHIFFPLNVYPSFSLQVEFYGDLKIPHNISYDPISYGRRGNNKEAMDAMVGCIISVFNLVEKYVIIVITWRPNFLQRTKLSFQLSTIINIVLLKVTRIGDFILWCDTHDSRRKRSLWDRYQCWKTCWKTFKTVFFEEIKQLIACDVTKKEFYL